MDEEAELKRIVVGCMKHMVQAAGGFVEIPAEAFVTGACVLQLKIDPKLDGSYTISLMTPEEVDRLTRGILDMRELMRQEREEHPELAGPSAAEQGEWDMAQTAVDQKAKHIEDLIQATKIGGPMEGGHR